MTDWQSIPLETVLQHATLTHREAHGSRPDVLQISIEGNEAILKDYTNSDTWFRRLLAPLLVLREVRSLKKLDSVTGVPRIYHVYSRYAFLMESITSTPASQLQKGMLDSEFFERMISLLGTIHKSGVVHCDLRSAGNTLVTKDQQPWVVDFVASIHQCSKWNPVGRWIFRQFVVADYSAVLKLKKNLAPQLLTKSDLSQLKHPKSSVERIGRKIGKSVRYVTRTLFPSKNK